VQKLTKEHMKFVENVGEWGDEIGMAPSIARVLGYLMICEPAHQSAAEIQEALHLSSGSVSNALVMLRQTRLIRRKIVTGNRKYYYEMEKGAWKEAAIRRLQASHKIIELAEDGLVISPHNDRLVDLRNVYQEFDKLVEKMKIHLEEL
jgi:DNA-binding transcriptional regulator GbsR (MarR family)